MKPIIPFALLGALLAVGAVNAAETTPVGYTVSTCPVNSDTVVGLPLRISATAAGALTAAPSGNTLTSSTSSFGSLANTHYVKFKAGPAAGKWFVITANTATTLTVDLNGDTMTAVSGDTFEVLKLWTLGELFNPATATTDAATTPHAIVASTGTLGTQRRTQILAPNLAGVGTNLAPSATYYIHGGVWKRAGNGDTDVSTTPLYPDNYFIIRNPATGISQATTYTIVGEVEMSNFAVPLSTRTGGLQDNFISLPRPVNLKFNDLNFGSAFVESTGTLGTQRRDQVLTYNNATAAQNKAPSATYFRHNGIWKRAGNGDADVGNEEIPGGFGFIVRKYQTAGGETSFWNNAPNY